MTSEGETAKDFLMSYLNLNVVTNMYGRASNDIGMSGFNKGNALYAWDLTAGKNCNVTHVAPVYQIGTLSVELNFSNPTPYELTVLCFEQRGAVISTAG